MEYRVYCRLESSQSSIKPKGVTEEEKLGRKLQGELE